MGHAEHHQDSSVIAPQAAERYGTRGVPGDWFLDPADPDAAERFRVEAEESLEDQATAFLAAHSLAAQADDTLADDTLADDALAEELDDEPLEASGPLNLTVPPLSAPARNNDQAVWIGLPGKNRDYDDAGELGWQADALCAQTDPEAFFPEKGGSTRDAKKVCGSCNVRAECLEFALENDERFGIWGGLSERERRRLRKRAG